MTLDEKDHQAVLKLNEIDQLVFSTYDPAIIYPVPNKWGKQGWTVVELKEILRDALKCAYCGVEPKKLIPVYKKKTPTN